MKVNHADFDRPYRKEKALSKEDEQLLTAAVNEFKKSGAY